MTVAGAADPVPGATAARTANVLGALALIVTDQTDRTVAARSGQSASSAAALSALHQFLDRPTVDKLRQVLGLTPSGAVRLVDRLGADGLVVRGPGADGRSRAVTLTASGRASAAELARARRDVLVTMLDGFSADEVQALERMLGRMMRNAVRAKAGGAWICRLCDLTACDRAAGRCPAMTAAAERYGRRPDVAEPDRAAVSGAESPAGPGE